MIILQNFGTDIEYYCLSIYNEPDEKHLIVHNITNFTYTIKLFPLRLRAYDYTIYTD